MRFSFFLRNQWPRACAIGYILLFLSAGQDQSRYGKSIVNRGLCVIDHCVCIFRRRPGPIVCQGQHTHKKHR